MEIRLLIKLQESQKRLQKITQKQMKKKHLEKKFISPELSQKVTDGVRIKKIIDDLKLKKEY